MSGGTAAHEAAERLDLIDAMLDRCRDRGVRLSHLEAARNALADLTGKHVAALAELEQLRAESAEPRARCHLCRVPLGIVVCTDCTEDLAAEGRRGEADGD